jgi:hypothetical protein
VGLLGISREELAQLEEEKVTGTKIVDPMALVPPELSRSIFQKQREVSLRIGGSVGVDEDYMEQLGLK